MISFLKKLFGVNTATLQQNALAVETPSAPEKPPLGELATLPLEDRCNEVISSAEAWPPSPQIAVGWGQSVGRQREQNEDSIFVLSTMLMTNNTQTPFGFFIIADGMGGHQHGEIASGLAVRALSTHVLRKLYLPLFNANPEPPDQSLQEILEDGIYEAHRTIIKSFPGSGTTLTAALIMGEQMTLTHVGDSRAYLFPANSPGQVLTRDHSLVKRLEELGQITAEEAVQHPQRNVLYRALGQGEPFEPDVSTFPLPHHGHLLLCSDGLWGVIPEKEIMAIICSTPDLHPACQALLDAANAAGGPDNISAILLRLTN